MAVQILPELEPSLVGEKLLTFLPLRTVTRNRDEGDMKTFFFKGPSK